MFLFVCFNEHLPGIAIAKNNKIRRKRSQSKGQSNKVRSEAEVVYLQSSENSGNCENNCVQPTFNFTVLPLGKEGVLISHLYFASASLIFVSR